MIGSAFAIYQISPEMTGMMLIVVPSVIAVGTFFGSFLRAISKMAQAQVSGSIFSTSTGWQIDIFKMYSDPIIISKMAQAQFASLQYSVDWNIGRFHMGIR